MLGKKIALALALLAVGGFVAWRYHSANTGGESLSVAATTPDKPTPPSVPATPSPLAANSAAKPAATPASATQGVAKPVALSALKPYSEVAKEYYTTKSVNDFFQKYASGPLTPEIALFLKDILMNCAAYKSEGLDSFIAFYKNPANKVYRAEERLQALSRLRASCNGLGDMPQEQRSALLNKYDEVMRSDEVVAKAKKLRFGSAGETLSPEEMRSLFAEVVKSGDPVAYRDLSGFMQGTPDKMLWQIGPDQTSADSKVLRSALAASHCYFGGQCERLPLVPETLCIRNTQCDPEENSLLYAQKHWLTPAEYQQMIATLEWLRPGYERGNWPPELFNLRPLSPRKSIPLK
ncbi:MAG: hypothetical protein JNM52_01005 [Betaproteobacteria bacterium]|nr:hypothetical protein [Betaproteobacteria bacterium]